MPVASRTCCWCSTVAPVAGLRDLPDGWLLLTAQGSGGMLFCSKSCVSAYIAQEWGVDGRQGRLV